jgi:hypothetical protein
MSQHSYRQQARFWSKVSVKSDSECWEWLGGKKHDGYGEIRWPTGERRSRVVGAHRVAYEIAKHNISPSDIVMHICDNPSCVNPQHLVIGTKRDNIVDMINKNRQGEWHKGPRPIIKGAGHRNAKLSEKQVVEIYGLKKQGEPASLIAKKYGISMANVYSIVYGKSWRKLWVKHHICE